MAERELTAVLLRGYESKDLDYKGPADWNEADKRACCELVKDVLAVANTNGGFIVIGVSERPDAFAWDGLPPEQALTWDTTRLNRFIQNYSDPPINALLRKISYSGKTFVIIEVPRFSDTPHICQREYPGVLTAPTLYVRTDNNESAPIKSSADFRTLVEQATRNPSDALLTAIRSILVGGVRSESTEEVKARDRFLSQRSDAVSRFESRDPYGEKGYTGYREASFFPDVFDETRFGLDRLRWAAEHAHVTFTGWPFLFIHRNRPGVTYVMEDGIETLIATEDFGGNDMLDFWRFQQSGFFYQRTLMWEETRTDESGTRLRVADFGAIAIYAAEAIYCATRLYEGLLKDDENLSVVLRFLGTENRRLTTFDVGRARLWDGYVCRIPQIEVEKRYSLADWRAGVVDHALSVAEYVYLRFNWEAPNLQAARQIIEKTFARKL
jgi:hypothetical protein